MSLLLRELVLVKVQLPPPLPELVQAQVLLLARLLVELSPARVWLEMPMVVLLLMPIVTLLMLLQRVLFFSRLLVLSQLLV